MATVDDDQAAVEPRRRPPVVATAMGLTLVWKWVELGVRFRVGWALIGSVRAVRERGVKVGSFQVPQVEPSAIERVL